MFKRALDLATTSRPPLSRTGVLVLRAHPVIGWLVELAGIEPASSSAVPGLLRVQSVQFVLLGPGTRDRHVADRPSQEKVPVNPPDRN